MDGYVKRRPMKERLCCDRDSRRGESRESRRGAGWLGSLKAILAFLASLDWVEQHDSLSWVFVLMQTGLELDTGHWTLDTGLELDTGIGTVQVNGS